MTATIASSTRVKFRLAGGAQPVILLPAHINGQGPFQFILDTGAGTSLLTPDLRSELDLEILGSKEGQTAGGKVSVALARVNCIALGEIALEDVDVGVVDLTPISTAVGAHIDGDLGYNFLRNFRVTIDYRGFEITLEDPKRTECLMRMQTEVPIRLANPAKPLILGDVHANGRGPFQFAIDTGTSTTAITPELAKELGVATRAAGPITTGGAKVAISSGTLSSIVVGGAKVNSLPVVVADFLDMLSSAIGAKLDGILGHNFLKNYKVAVDYPGKRIALL